MALRSGSHLIGSTLRQHRDHPLVRAVAASGGSQARWRAAEEAACVEAAVARARRVAGREPPAAFVQTIAAAAREVRAVAGQYPREAVAAWRGAVLRELGALLFERVAEIEVGVRVGRDPYLARRDGDA